MTNQDRMDRQAEKAREEWTKRRGTVPSKWNVAYAVIWVVISLPSLLTIFFHLFFGDGRYGE